MALISETSGAPSREREPLLRRTASMEESIGNDDVISKQVKAAPTTVDETKQKEIKDNLAKYEQLFGADEDAFVQPTTSYYLYYNASEIPSPILIIY